MPVVQQKQFVIGRHQRKCTSELILFLADVDTENSGHLRSYYENLSSGCGSGADIHATLMCEKEVQRLARLSTLHHVALANQLARSCDETACAASASRV